MLLEPACYVRLFVKLSNENIIGNALVDSGSPISLVKSCIVKERDRQPFSEHFFISGINGIF